MCNYYCKAGDALRRLIVSRDGVVSFEYVVVAAAIVGAVAVFGSSAGTGPIKDALTTALNAIVTRVGTVVGG
ncbi:hypothetical protein J2R76_002536 [Bradyrhizobium sp. USDA 4532]|nr:hypothetical protein [Bradyrhizobium sp. USDA 4545]MCP1918945.1 hypothetical protein [Bradyrhizobium sp. USDA 4532]